MIEIRLTEIESEDWFIHEISQVLEKYTYGPGLNAYEISEQVFALMMGWA